MTRQRKRLSTPHVLHNVSCLTDSRVKRCDHCQYVIHELLAHEQRWTHIARSVIQNEEAVADLVQEFYVSKLPKKIHNFDIENPSFQLVPYVARIIYNFAIDELRRTSRHSILDGQRYISGLTRDEDEQVLPNVSNEIEARDLLTYLCRALSDSDSGLLQRMLVPGWSIREEAINEQVSSGAIRARVTRLRDRVESLIKLTPNLA